MEIQQRKRVAITSSFFPVDESLLPQLNISPAQHEELRRYALQAALDTVRDGPTWGRSNIEHAVSNGWKVLSARPTACFMTKRQTKTKKKRNHSRRGVQLQLQHQQSGEQQEEDDKRSTPPTPRVTVPGLSSLGSFHGTDIVRSAMPFQPFAPVPLEAASGQHFMAHAVLPNSLEDVMNTLYSEHTGEMRALKKKVYGEAALDCCVLQTLEGATLEDPFWYLGLKWLALRSPMQALMASREFVYLEHLGTHVDPETGRRMLYRVAQSVHIRGYGGQDSYFGLTRGHIEAAFVYWMDDENEARNPLLHVCAKGRLHMKGSMPDSVVYKFLKSFWRTERSLFTVGRSSGSSTGITITGADAAPTKVSKKKKKKKKSRRRKVPMGPPLEMAHEWVADELRPRCSVCNKKFRIVRRFKHHCRACGEVICRECTFQHRVNVRATQSFRGLRGTIGSTMTDSKHAKKEPPPTNFDETMTCSFDNQVIEEGELEGSKGGEFDASQSLVKARKAVNGPLETAVLGGESVVCVVMAKVCIRCLQSVPLVNRSKTKSPQRRRHSEMAFSAALPAEIAEGDEFDFEDKFPVRPQTWTPGNREVEELDGLDDDDLGQATEQDLPMLMMDDDAESVDDLTEMKRRPGSYAFDSRPGSSMFARPSSYAQEWNGEDGGLDSFANHERVVILSPHALSATSSVTSVQMKELLERDESSHDSSGHSERYDVPSDVDCDNESIQFYPTQVDESKPAAEGSQGRMSSHTSGFDPTCLFELKDEEDELAASAAAATATVSATEKVLRRMRDLQDEALYQNRQVPSPSSSTTSLYSEDDKCSETDEPLQDLRQALAQVESSLADQARILFTIEQERKKDAAFAAASSPKV